MSGQPLFNLVHDKITYESSNIQGFLVHFPAIASKFFPKRFLIFSQKKVFLIFQEMELSSSKIRKFLILTGLSPQNFSLKNFFSEKDFLIFRRRNLLIYREMYIQNPGIFSTREIFRTVAYSEAKAYSEHCRTSMMKRFAKIAT